MVQISDVLTCSRLIWCGDAVSASDEGSTVRLRCGLQMPQLGLGSGDLEGREGREAVCIALRAGATFPPSRGTILLLLCKTSELLSFCLLAQFQAVIQKAVRKLQIVRLQTH